MVGTSILGSWISHWNMSHSKKTLVDWLPQWGLLCHQGITTGLFEWGSFWLIIPIFWLLQGVIHYLGFLCHQETWGYSSECCNVQSVCCTLTHINIYIHYRNQVPKTDIVGPVVFCLKGYPAQILLQLASSNPDIFTPGLLHIRVASGLSDSLTFQGS